MILPGSNPKNRVILSAFYFNFSIAIQCVLFVCFGMNFIRGKRNDYKISSTTRKYS